MNKIKKVPFNGDKILVVEKDDKKYVAMKPITEALGLDWSGQLRIIRNDPVLNEGMDVTSIPSKGGSQEMVCLPLEYLNGWLFKIPALRYTGCRREAIIKYQRECYQALYRYFHKEKPCSDNMRKIISAITTEAAKKDEVIAALKTQVVRLLELIGVATSEPFVEGHRRCGGKCRQDTKTEFFRILRELLPDENQAKK
jgi:hypothetical protein